MILAIRWPEQCNPAGHSSFAFQVVITKMIDHNGFGGMKYMVFIKTNHVPPLQDHDTKKINKIGPLEANDKYNSAEYLKHERVPIHQVGIKNC